MPLAISSINHEEDPGNDDAVEGGKK